MKAKEEYVDAPRETRSKDITVYAIIFLVLLVGAGIFLAVRLLYKPADAALAGSKSGIVYDSSAVEGGWDNLSPEEIAERLNQKVEEGMINISMNTAPYFENGTSEGNVILSRSQIAEAYLKLTRGLAIESRRTLDDCIDRLVTRGLVAEGRGSSEYAALYDLLSCLYIAPVSANPFLRFGVFLKLWLWNGVAFSKAIQLFSRPKSSAEERQIVRLANQALLSSAELIRCAERGVRTLRSDEQLTDCLYDNELTTSENLPILMAASRQARPVSAAIANLYLHKQIVFERC